MVNEELTRQQMEMYTRMAERMMQNMCEAAQNLLKEQSLKKTQYYREITNSQNATAKAEELISQKVQEASEKVDDLLHDGIISNSDAIDIKQSIGEQSVFVDISDASEKSASLDCINKHLDNKSELFKTDKSAFDNISKEVSDIGDISKMNRLKDQNLKIDKQKIGKDALINHAKGKTNFRNKIGNMANELTDKAAVTPEMSKAVKTTKRASKVAVDTSKRAARLAKNTAKRVSKGVTQTTSEIGKSVANNVSAIAASGGVATPAVIAKQVVDVGAIIGKNAIKTAVGVGKDASKEASGAAKDVSKEAAKEARDYGEYVMERSRDNY